MYKIKDPDEIAFWKHILRAHNGMVLPTCLLCNRYKRKIEKKNKENVTLWG